MSQHNSPPTILKVRRPRWLVPLITLIGLLALLALLWTAFNDNRTTTTSTEGPRLSADTTVLDYGDVSFGTPIESVFTLRNDGDETLVFLRDPQVELLDGC